MPLRQLYAVVMLCRGAIVLAELLGLLDLPDDVVIRRVAGRDLHQYGAHSV